MENPAPSSEAEPDSKQSLSFAHWVWVILFFWAVWSACNEKQPQQPEPGKPNADSHRAIRQQWVADSLSKVSAAKKKIYITFDDSPNKGTRNVLKTIREEGVPVTFFVVGKHAFDSPSQKETWNMLQADSSLALCNHSFSHALNRYTKFYRRSDSVIRDFQKAEQSLQLTNKVARMPGRNAWRIGTIDHTDIKESKAAIDSLHLAGYDIMGWDVEWRFNHRTFAADTNTALLLRQIDNMLEAGTSRTPGHLVLLAHDQAFQKPDDIVLLQTLLRALKNRPDYELRLASHYPGIRKAAIK